MARAVAVDRLGMEALVALRLRAEVSKLAAAKSPRSGDVRRDAVFILEESKGD